MTSTSKMDDNRVKLTPEETLEQLHAVLSQTAKEKGFTREDLAETLKEVRREGYEEMYGE